MVHRCGRGDVRQWLSLAVDHVDDDLASRPQDDDVRFGRDLRVIRKLQESEAAVVAAGEQGESREAIGGTAISNRPSAPLRLLGRTSYEMATMSAFATPFPPSSTIRPRTSVVPESGSAAAAGNVGSDHPTADRRESRAMR